MIKRIIEIKDAACQAPLFWVNNDTLTSIRLNSQEDKGWVHTPSSCHLCLMRNTGNRNSKMSKCFLKNHLHIECTWGNITNHCAETSWTCESCKQRWSIHYILSTYFNIITSGCWLLHAPPLPSNSHWLTRATSICSYSICCFCLSCTVHILPRRYIAYKSFMYTFRLPVFFAFGHAHTCSRVW